MRLNILITIYMFIEPKMIKKTSIKAFAIEEKSR
jgi:hypothetical protein